MEATVSRAGAFDGAARMAPIGAFAAIFGAAFGAAAIEAGLSGWAAFWMSATVFAGVSQFAALEIWADPPPVLAIALVVALANLRHVVFGASLASVANALPIGRRLAALSVLSDANFADVRARIRAGSRDLGPMVGGGVLLWVAWMIGTAIGVGAGAVVDDLGRFGVDVVMAGFFTALLVGGLERPADAAPIAAAALAAVACVLGGFDGAALLVAVAAGVAVEALRPEGAA